MTSTSPRNPRDRRHLPRIHQVFVFPSQVHGKHVTIGDTDSHHLVHVLRLGVGDTIRIVITTEQPQAHSATIRSLSGSQLVCELTEKLHTRSRLDSPRLSIAHALFQDEFEVSLRGLAELGVAEVIPFISERSVVRPDRVRQERRLARWQEIVRLDAALSHYLTYPKVTPVRTLGNLLDTNDPHMIRIVLDLDDTIPPLADLLPDPAMSILLVIGPEGGFSEQEREHLSTAGFSAAHLGPNTFRAQYAGIVSATIVRAHYNTFAIPPV